MLTVSGWVLVERVSPSIFALVFGALVFYDKHGIDGS